MENRKPIEVTFSDEITLAKHVTQKSLEYLFGDYRNFKYGHHWYTFEGDYRRLQEVRAYGKQYGTSTVSDEGIARVSFFWTELPVDEILFPTDICLIKPFLIQSVPSAKKLNVVEYTFMSMDPDLYRKVIADPNLLVL